MKKFNLILTLLFFSFVLVSCQKEFSSEEDRSGGTGTGSGSSLTGTWKLLEIEAKTSNTVVTGTGATQEKMITLSHYITKNNTGTIVFDGSKFTQTNISYSIDTIARGSYYVGGALIDQSEVPFQFTLPAYNATGTYRVIGSDSLYFDGGMGFMSNATVPGAPGGMKYRIQGDKLYMTTDATTTQSQVVQGLTVVTTSTVQGEVRLQKQ